MFIIKQICINNIFNVLLKIYYEKKNKIIKDEKK